MFTVLWIGFLLFILYSFLKSCLRRDTAHRQTPNHRPDGSGWFSGGPRGYNSRPPPPPYSKDPVTPGNNSWTPGFWTGAALGGLGTYLMSDRRRTEEPRMYDWERARNPRAPLFGGGRMSRNSEDRGEGSSNLGAMRRSTGFGGSTVR